MLEVTGGVLMNYFVFDVPLPEDGKITVTPRDQPSATLDATKVATKPGRHGTHGVTLIYTRKDFGVYELSFMWRGDTREETIRGKQAAREWLKQHQEREQQAPLGAQGDGKRSRMRYMSRPGRRRFAHSSR